MTRFPLDVWPGATPRHPGVVLSAPTTSGKRAGGAWAKTSVEGAETIARAIEAATTSWRAVRIFIAMCPPPPESWRACKFRDVPVAKIRARRSEPFVLRLQRGDPIVGPG